MHIFQGKYVAQDPRDYLFLVPKWNLLLNQESLTFPVILQTPLAGSATHPNTPEDRHRTCHLERCQHYCPQVASRTCLQTVYSTLRSPTATPTCSSDWTPTGKCPNTRRVTYPLALLLPAVSVQLLHLAKGFIIEKPRLCIKWSLPLWNISTEPKIPD